MGEAKYNSLNKRIEELENIARQSNQQLQQVYKAYQESQSQLQQYRTEDYRRIQVNQCYDFALQSVPESGRNIVDIVLQKAKDIHEAIEAETTRLFEADKAAYEAKQKEERLEREAKEDEAIIEKGIPEPE